jgi:DnaJ-domain-containing protein 1
VAESEDIPADISDVGNKGDRPTLNTAVNLTEVRLTPVEGFVLSRVDGRTSYEDICHVSGLPVAATLDILRKLRREGLILNPGEKPEQPDPAKAKAQASPGTASRPRRRLTLGVPVAVSLLEVHDDGSPVDRAELDKGPGLDEDTKARILRLHRRLKTLKPHELLALSPGADPAMVKRAYFAASKELHPDRFYGKDMGPYRDKLSDIFAQLTRAFEQLKK